MNQRVAGRSSTSRSTSNARRLTSTKDRDILSLGALHPPGNFRVISGLYEDNGN